MINAIEWFKEKGFTFDDKITIKDVIDLQKDAYFQGLKDSKTKQNRFKPNPDWVNAEP